MSSPEVRLSAPTLKVLKLFIEAPRTRRSGAEISRLAGIGSGTLYPLLARLEGAGWLKPVGQGGGYTRLQRWGRQRRKTLSPTFSWSWECPYGAREAILGVSRGVRRIRCHDFPRPRERRGLGVAAGAGPSNHSESRGQAERERRRRPLFRGVACTSAGMSGTIGAAFPRPRRVAGCGTYAQGPAPSNPPHRRQTHAGCNE